MNNGQLVREPAYVKFMRAVLCNIILKGVAC